MHIGNWLFTSLALATKHRCAVAAAPIHCAGLQHTLNGEHRASITIAEAQAMGPSFALEWLKRIF